MAGRSALRGSRVGLEGLDVRRVRALGAVLGVVGDLRALGQRLEAAALDGGVVDEEVLALIVRGDEAEALLVAEPLNGSGCHGDAPPWDARAAKRWRCWATTAGRWHFF